MWTIKCFYSGFTARYKRPLFHLTETKGCDPVKHPLITRKAGIVNWVTPHALFWSVTECAEKGFPN